MKIFVVLDPSLMEQVSLEWGEQIALSMKAERGLDTSLHVYCCINDQAVTMATLPDAGSARAATIRRVEDWVDRLVAQSKSLGLPVTTEVEWEDNWRGAIVQAAARQQSALVIKNSTPHSKVVRLVRETSDWLLLRDCECPVLLLKSGRSYSIDSILVAVKHQPEEDVYEAANDTILEFARDLSADLDASLHAVTCYHHEKRPDRQRFADRCGLDRNQVHAASGTPEKIIAEVASDVNADLLVIARVAKPEQAGIMGDTARKLIDEIDTDVLVLPMTNQES